MTEETLGRLARRELSAREIAAVLRHTGECPDCAKLAATQAGLDRDADALQAMLAATPRDPESHPDLAAYVDGMLDAADTEIVESHLDDCEICRADLADLHALRRTMPARGPRRARWRIALPIAAAAAIGTVVFLQRSDDGVLPPVEPVQPPITRTDTAVPTTTTTSEPTPPPRYANAEWERLVDTAISTATLPFPADLAALGAPDTLRGPDHARTIALSPAGVVVDETRPRFTWPPRPGATFAVLIFSGNTEVANSGPLTSTSWTPPHPLPRGRTYVWQLEVTGEGTREIVPAPPAPPAMFRIVSARNHEEIANARRLHPNDHVLHAVLAARAGLKEEALKALGRAEGREAEGLVKKYANRPK